MMDVSIARLENVFLCGRMRLSGSGRPRDRLIGPNGGFIRTINDYYVECYSTTSI